MALSSVLRSLAAVSKQSVTGVASVCARELQSKGFATDATLSRKEVVYMLENRDDPEVDSAIKAYLKAQYKSGADAAEKPEQALELATKVERKYVAAQVVDYGIQNIALPLSADGPAPVKRFAAQLLKLGAKAGFEDPATEVSKRIAEKAQTAESAKELLTRIKPYMSAEFHSALNEALLAVEAETNSTVTLDGASAGYKKFAEKVKAVATAHGIPWKLLVDAKNPSGSEEAQDKVKRDYTAWAQSARVADAAAEVAVFRAEATSLLDKHLTKTVEQVRKEQAATLATLQRRIDGARGAKWATEFQQDLKNIAWFDAAVAADPANGPAAKVAA